ncbi:MAG: DUF3108 domain-containing protein [Bacteroidia bacterium]|nr:DUF3108 domain-containing protein [Bacteroidia bacterium]
MIKQLIIVLITPMLLIATGSKEQVVDHHMVSSENVLECGPSNTTFDPGEEITYQLAYKWGVINMNAGEVTFRVEDLGNRYRFSAFGRTYAGYEWFYKVRDYYETVVDKATLLPLVAKKRISEGKYRLYENVKFDHDKGVAIALRGKTKETAVKKEYPIESCMYDILSILYLTRNLRFDNLNIGDKFPVRFFMDKKIYPIEVIYGGKDPKKRVKANGLHKTVIFKPQLRKNKLFPDGGEMSVWVSDDQNRIPLLIESPVSVGKVRAILKDHKGLKNPLDSNLNQ